MVGRDKAPGQRQCDYSIDNINKCIRDIEQASLAAVGQSLPCRDDISSEVQSLLMLEALSLLLGYEVSIESLVPFILLLLLPFPPGSAGTVDILRAGDWPSHRSHHHGSQRGSRPAGTQGISLSVFLSPPLRASSTTSCRLQFSPEQSTYYPSVSHQGLFLSQVTQLASYFEPLIVASVGLASRLLDHQQQMTILDQTKTLSESALQMLYAAKEGGGNPKVLPLKHNKRWVIVIAS